MSSSIRNRGSNIVLQDRIGSSTASLNLNSTTKDVELNTAAGSGLKLDTLAMGAVRINQLTTDMLTALDTKIPTEKAVVDYVAAHGGGGGIVCPLELIPAGPVPYTLKIAFDAANFATEHVSATGDMTIDCTGNDLNVHSSDRFHVLNVTPSTDFTTGAMVVDGGIAAAAASTVSNLLINTATLPQLTIANDAGLVNKTEFSTSAAGDLTINTSGTTINTHATDLIRILNDTESTNSTNGACVITGGLGVRKRLNLGSTLSFSGVEKRLDLLAAAVRGPADAPSPKITSTYWNGWEFNAVDSRYLYGACPVPKNLNITYGVQFEIMFCGDNATAGNVLWQHSTKAFTAGDTPNSANDNTTLATVPAASIGKLIRLVVRTGAVLESSDMMFFRIYRDGANANDTYPGSAILVEWRMIYSQTTL